MTLSIYVADLAAYNNGILQGAWLDVDGFDKDDIQSAIHELMVKWGVEEWAIHDYENFPQCFGEYPDFGELAKYIKATESHGKEVVDAYLEIFDFTEIEQIEDRFYGVYDSDEDFAYSYLDDSGEINSIPEHLRYYFDYESWLSDQVLNGTFSYVRANFKTYIFSGF